MPPPEPIPDLLKSANEASGRGFALWVTFLTVEIYLAIAAGTTTHKQLLLEAPVKLPLLSVDLPLFAFYVFVPALFVCLHLYVLVQLYLLARKLRMFDDELRAWQTIEVDRERQRAQLDTFVLTQFLVGGPKSQTVRLFLQVTIRSTLIIGPALLLLFMQLRFLPYHDVLTTWVQRFALLVDLGLIWVMWPAIAVGMTSTRRTAQSRAGHSMLAVVCAVLAMFSVLVATVPQEPIEESERSLYWRIHKSSRDVFWSPARMLLERMVDEGRRWREIWLSRNLVLKDQRLLDLDEDALAKRIQTLVLRDRDLRRAELVRADLRKADLSGAQLQGALLDGTRLNGATLNDARLQGASLKNAQLQDSRFDGAHLEGASLDRAQLQDARFGCTQLDCAHLEGASLNFAQLKGALLDRAHLEGASLDRAQLQGASLDRALLEGASLDRAQLQGASLDGAHLEALCCTDRQADAVSVTSFVVRRGGHTPAGRVRACDLVHELRRQPQSCVGAPCVSATRRRSRA
jgi:uncharacterized protein YjbI with pentapeptide repeats